MIDYEELKKIFPYYIDDKLSEMKYILDKMAKYSKGIVIFQDVNVYYHPLTEENALSVEKLALSNFKLLNYLDDDIEYICLSLINVGTSTIIVSLRTKTPELLVIGKLAM